MSTTVQPFSHRPLLEDAAFGIKPIVTEATHAGTDLDLL
jgi:hypothetical protein